MNTNDDQNKPDRDSSTLSHTMVHLVDCNSYVKGQLEYQTISEALAENKIVKVTKEEDGKFRVEEMCDEYFAAFLTAAQLITWADELHAMAAASNEKGQR